MLRIWSCPRLNSQHNWGEVVWLFKWAWELSLSYSYELQKSWGRWLWAQVDLLTILYWLHASYPRRSRLFEKSNHLKIHPPLSLSWFDVFAADVCTNKDISIFQSPDGSSGIPQFIVQIVNTCMNECAPSNIHVFCGWFASAQLVNPNAFKRLAYNDCLVNGGRPLRHGEIVRFTYANSFMYPIRFMSANFCK